MLSTMLRRRCSSGKEYLTGVKSQNLFNRYKKTRVMVHRGEAQGHPFQGHYGMSQGNRCQPYAVVDPQK